jgi:hypothetical protein
MQEKGREPNKARSLRNWPLTGISKTTISGLQTIDDVDNELKSFSAVTDPYFRYIANDIRLGQI